MSEDKDYATRIQRSTGNTTKTTAKMGSNRKVLKGGGSADRTDKPKFGAVRVNAPVLSQAVDTKTYVITNRTSARELVNIVLTGYRVIYENCDFFFIQLDKLKHNGSSSPKSKRLEDTDKPLEIQSQYARGETRFSLQMKPDVSIVMLHDRCIDIQIPSRSAFLSESATCVTVIELVIASYRGQHGQDAINTTADDYILCEVDASTNVSHELPPSCCPVITQKQWLERYECYFQIKHKADNQEKDGPMRRALSLEEIGGYKKLLNFKEIKKSNIPKRRGRRELPDTTNLSKPSNDNVAADNGMTKLRNSLTQLRDHLENVHKNREEEPNSEESKNGSSTLQRLSLINRARNSKVCGRHMRSLSHESKPISSRRLSTDGGSRAEIGSSRRASSQERPKDSQIADTGNLTKSQSLQDLGTSSSYRLNLPSNSKPRLPSRRSGEVDPSQENLSAFERRKMYDLKRKGSIAEAKKVSDSGIQDMALDFRKDFLDSNMSVDSARLSRKSSASSTSSRNRRSLPKVPSNENEVEIELRKKRISQKALNIASSKKDKESVVLDTSSTKSDASSYLQDGEAQIIEPEKINVLCIEESALRSDSGSSQNSAKRTQKLKPKDMQFKPLHPHPPTHKSLIIPKEPVHVKSTSQEALQKLISDLRDAASDNSYISCPSIIASHSSFTSSTDPNCLENHINGTSYHGDIEQIYMQRTSTPDQTGSDTSHPESHDQNFLSLHSLLKSHDLCYVTLRHQFSQDTSIENALAVTQSSSQSRTSQLAGKRPVLGQNGSAFVQVGSNANSYWKEKCPVAPLVVSSIDREMLFEQEGQLFEGDIVVELNSTQMLGRSVADMMTQLSNCEGDIRIVIARHRDTAKQKPVKDPDTHRELEKYKLKFSAMKQDADKYMDLVADLKLELKSRDDIIHGLDLDLKDLQRQLAAYTNQSNCRMDRTSDHNGTAEIAQLKFEANQKDGRIEKLRNLLIQQNEMLNINNSNGDQRNCFSNGSSGEYQYLDYEYEGTHVSAV